MKRILFILLILLFTTNLFAMDRCQNYVNDIRKYSIMYNGIDFPYWYNIGVAKTESSCRADITSFDVGQGLMQLTPSTGITSELRRYIPVNPYDAESSIRAQSYYVMLIRTKKFKQKEIIINKKYKAHPVTYVEKCGMNLADIYRYYNSGYWFFYESERGKFVCDNKQMKKYCVRGGTWIGTGKKRKWLSFCDVSYSYPEKIYEYSQPYRLYKDGQQFWYEGKYDKIK